MAVDDIELRRVLEDLGDVEVFSDLGVYGAILFVTVVYD
jgi:hypothetical protein